jgi:hypothetical protein
MQTPWSDRPAGTSPFFASLPVLGSTAPGCASLANRHDSPGRPAGIMRPGTVAGTTCIPDAFHSVASATLLVADFLEVHEPTKYPLTPTQLFSTSAST